MFDESFVNSMDDTEDDLPASSAGEKAIHRLLMLGQKNGYITIDDILSFFPQAERDVEGGNEWVVAARDSESTSSAWGLRNECAGTSLPISPI